MNKKWQHDVQCNFPREDRASMTINIQMEAAYQAVQFQSTSKHKLTQQQSQLAIAWMSGHAFYAKAQRVDLESDTWNQKHAAVKRGNKVVKIHRVQTCHTTHTNRRAIATVVIVNEGAAWCVSSNTDNRTIHEHDGTSKKRQHDVQCKLPREDRA